MAFEALAQTPPLNDTGQIACYNATASTGTVSVGAPDPESVGFNEQDRTRRRAAADAVGVPSKVGASSEPERDYTRIANNGTELPASAVLRSQGSTAIEAIQVIGASGGVGVAVTYTLEVNLTLFADGFEG